MGLRPPMPCEGCGRPIAQALPICPLCGHRRAGFVPKEVPPEPAPKADPVAKELPKEARAQMILLMHQQAASSVETVRKLDRADRILTFLVWPAILPGLFVMFPFVRSREKVDSFWVVGAGSLALGYLALEVGGVVAALSLVPVVAWIARGVVRAVARAREGGA